MVEGKVACLSSASVIQFSAIPLVGVSTAGFNSHASLYAFHYVPTIFPWGFRSQFQREALFVLSHSEQCNMFFLKKKKKG